VHYFAFEKDIDSLETAVYGAENAVRKFRYHQAPYRGNHRETVRAEVVRDGDTIVNLTGMRPGIPGKGGESRDILH
jgi:hypothetical protein